MPLKVGEYVFYVNKARLKVLQVARVVPKGRPPRYEFNDFDGNEFEFPYLR